MNNSERLNDPEAALGAALDGMLAQLWTATPGIVQAVDLCKQTCTVQPAIQGEVSAPDGSSQTVNLPLLVDVPIVFPRAGGFAVTFPLAAGDEVLVVFAARCIDAWYQSGGVQPAAEARMHDLSDGFAIPGPTSQPRKLVNVSATNMQMRTEDGAAYIEMTPAGGVKIKCTSYEVDSSGAASMKAATAATVDGAALVLKSAGSADMQTPGGIIHNGKDVGSAHAHSGVTAGAANSGAVA